LLEATICTSTATSSLPPTRRNRRSSIAVRSFACSSALDLADLVEEQRAALRLLHQAAAAALRAGERARLVAEQLRLEQLARQRRAVDLDERPVPAPAAVVEDPRREALAGPGLAGEEHRAERHFGELREQLAHAARGGARAGERLERIAPVVLRALLPQPALGAGAARSAGDDEIEAFQVARLLEEIVGAQAHAAHRIADRPVAGQEQPLAVRGVPLERLEEVERVAVREAHVREHHEGVDRLVGEETPRLEERARAHDLPAGAPQMTRERNDGLPNS
jgi:hypothetical protein